jgi:hypothetical protein
MFGALLNALFAAQVIPLTWWLILITVFAFELMFDLIGIITVMLKTKKNKSESTDQYDLVVVNASNRDLLGTKSPTNISSNKMNPSPSDTIAGTTTLQGNSTLVVSTFGET